MNLRAEQIIRGKMAPTPKSMSFSDEELLLTDDTSWRIAIPDLPDDFRQSLKNDINRYWGISPQFIFNSMGKANDLVPDGYELKISHSGVEIHAGSLPGLRYALCTLRQLAEFERGVYQGSRYTLPCGEIKDRPRFNFRGMHLCVFPETGLVELEKAVRLAAYYKFNRIVLEFWGTFPFESHPEFSIPGHALSRYDLDRFLILGKNLGIKYIPQFNLLGHAAGSRLCSGKHVVLDRHPELQSLFEPDGWTWCLSNPEARRVQTELVDELCAGFAPLDYFHIGFDEAYDVATCATCRNREVKALLREQLMHFHDHLGDKGMKMIMWHDMLLNYKDPRWNGYMAGGTPEERTYELLEELPRDIVIADWQYEYCAEKAEGGEPGWPTLKYFKDCGFPVLATSFNSEAAIRGLGRQAAEQQIFGILGTSWHLLSNSMYEIYYNTAQTAWGHPGYCRHARLPFNTHLRQVAEDMGIENYNDFGCMKKQI